MKTLIIKSLDRIIVFLLFIMGVFSSCTKEEPRPEYDASRYGVPQSYNYEKSIIINEEIIQPAQDVIIISEIDSQDETVL